MKLEFDAEEEEDGKNGILFFFFFLNGLNCMTVLSVLLATGKCEVGCQGRR